jgi:acyl-CoA oxidase
MITQQTASYLIKKMTEAVKSSNSASTDETVQLFRSYIQNRDGQVAFQALVNGSVDDEAVVKAFKWRAAALVWLPSLIIHWMTLSNND